MEYVIESDYEIPTIDGGVNNPICRYVLKFNSDGTGKDLHDESEFYYEMKDTLLAIGSRLYILEKLTSDSLVIRDYEDNLILSSQRYHLYKME